jgi:putative pantetheine hydrolase
VDEGVVGAGAGARAGGLKGGIGSASYRLPSGATVGALVAVNAFGSTVDPATGELYAARHCLPGDLPQLRLPDAAEVTSARAAAAALQTPFKPALATTIGVVATDATLTKAQCAKVSGIGHDGLARAINPVHTMFDGDTIFTLATGAAAAPDPVAFHELLEAASACVTRAVARAVLAAATTYMTLPAPPPPSPAPGPASPAPSPAPGPASPAPALASAPGSASDAVPVRSYRDAFPSAFSDSFPG